jgi:hypothetical protein
MDQGGLGEFGKQPAGEILQADGDGQEAVEDGVEKLGEAFIGDRAGAGHGGIKGKPQVEVDEELQFHIEQSTAANRSAGMTAEEARRQALVEFGCWGGAGDGSTAEELAV